MDAALKKAICLLAFAVSPVIPFKTIHSNVTTTLGLYAHRVNASMMAAQTAMMQALETSSQTTQ